jgi:hypothetical protein
VAEWKDLMMSPRECEYCHKVSEDVEEMEDPFLSEIRDDHTLYLICPKCYEESTREI